MAVLCAADCLSAEKARPEAFHILGSEEGPGSLYVQGVAVTQPLGLHILVGGADV